jgi:spore coat protein B
MILKGSIFSIECRESEHGKKRKEERERGKEREKQRERETERERERERERRETSMCQARAAEYTNCL